MKANELRIGNNVQHCGGWSYRNEGYFDFQWNESDWYAIGECTLDLERVKPIPLTEEWLLKCGAERRSDKNKFYLKGYSIAILSNKFYFNPSSTQGLSVHLKHVHQLQNLYFSLTGKELTTKKPSHNE